VEEKTDMSDDGFETWLDRIDADRVRATSGGIAGGWAVVAVIAILIAVVPPAVATADVALAGAKQGVEKVEHELAQVIPRFTDRVHPC
jgi:hypothetical protein